ncbi:hypothetical protein GCM10023178_62730 [Actinomadura luteofluorescens]
MPVRVWSTFTVGASHARMNRLHVGKLRTFATHAVHTPMVPPQKPPGPAQWATIRPMA